MTEQHLLDHVYSDLEECAARYLRRERRGHLLEPTALVNEALLRLMTGEQCVWQDASHFVATAAMAMRRILVDHARSHLTAKRGGARCRVPLQEDTLSSPPLDLDGLDVRSALTKLAARDPQQARIVELRYLDGCSVEEAAVVLGISPATVKRKWDLARVWLGHRLKSTTTASA